MLESTPALLGAAVATIATVSVFYLRSRANAPSCQGSRVACAPEDKDRIVLYLMPAHKACIHLNYVGHAVVPTRSPASADPTGNNM